MIYTVTEWNGRGSGECTLITQKRAEAFANREYRLTYHQAVKKYGKDYFRCSDIPGTTVDSYRSYKDLNLGRVATTKTYY